MSKALIGCLLALALLCNSADAGLVKVNFFGPASGTGTAAAYSVGAGPGAVSVTRTFTSIFGSSSFSGGTFLAIGGSSFRVRYDILGGKNFGDLFATSGVSGDYFDGFELVLGSFGSDPNVTITTNSGSNSFGLSSGENLFRGIALPSDNFVELLFTQTLGVTTFTQVSAVPEPTALALVATGIVSVVSMRRRRR